MGGFCCILMWKFRVEKEWNSISRRRKILSEWRKRFQFLLRWTFMLHSKCLFDGSIYVDQLVRWRVLRGLYDNLVSRVSLLSLVVGTETLVAAGRVTATRVSVPTTKGGREERSWEWGWLYDSLLSPMFSEKLWWSWKPRKWEEEVSSVYFQE